MLLVGYQAAGTLGRILQDGASTVRIQGEEISVRARIRKLDVYSGHADGTELAAWVKARLPVKSGLFLVHGEEGSLAGLGARLEPVLGAGKLHVPSLDAAYRLAPEGPVLLSEGVEKPRIDPVSSGKPDWHNDTQTFLLDLNDALARAGDAKSRRVILRRLKRALEEE